MKILAIRGKNIASLAGEFAVDFTAEPLVSANIFAISGPTGAGKSSLLDTMCLALFSRTPRTDQAKELNVRLRDISDDALGQSDPRFLLRRGTANGYAETDFVALNGHRYRARWSVSRAREKESGRLQNPKLSLFNLDKGCEEQGTRSELLQKITDLIGLTFEQFTRSVLLAQNDFSTFLKAEQGEKAALLEKLTGTELYSRISKRIFERNAEAKAAFDVVQTKIAGIELLPAEEEEVLKQQAKDDNALLLQLDKARKEWDALNEAVTGTSALLKKKEEDRKEAEETLTKSLRLRDKAKKDLEEDANAIVDLERAFREMQPRLQEARKADTELGNAGKELAECQKRLTEAATKKKETEQKLGAISTSLQKQEKEKTAIAGWFDRYKTKEKIATQLPTLLLHLDVAERIRLTLEKEEQERRKAETESEDLTKQLELFALNRRKKETEVKDLNEQRIRIEQAINVTDVTAIEQQKEANLVARESLLQEQLLFSSVGNDAKELRSKLTENTPCPVCGSLDHPYASREVHAKMLAIQERIIALTKQVNLVDKQLKEIAEKRKMIDKLREQSLNSYKELTDMDKNGGELVNRQNLLNNKLHQLKEGSKQHQQEINRALNAISELFENESWIENWQENPLAFRRKLTGFVSEWKDKETRSRELENLLSGLKAEQSSYAAFFVTLNDNLGAAQTSFDKQDAFYKALQEKRKQLLGGKDADQMETERQTEIEQKKKQLARLQSTLNEQSGIAEQARGQQNQIAKDLTALVELSAKTKSSLEAWMENYHASSGGLLPQERWAKVMEQKTAGEFRLHTQESNKKRIALLRGEADNKQQISEQWAKLNELAGSADGAKFRRIAQSYTLDLLLSYANVHLQSLTNRYRLERVPETLALQVVDCDMLDEIRTVHSLSGGESFLVSLALALGLSSLSSNRMNVESLFIDEGFGSLDAETLRAAMDALENLRTQGRKIGVISHVQEMTERIPVQIRVNRLGNGRSAVEII